MAQRAMVGVIGSSDPQAMQQARILGRLLAEAGWVILCGGRNEGVQATVCAGAKEVEGSLTVGILPNGTAEVSPHLDIAVVTDLNNARNNVIGLSSRVVVACGVGGTGTASEVALALKNGKRVILLAATPEAQAFFCPLEPERVLVAETPEEAVALAAPFRE